ncbi:MAG: ATP-binding cassette domain-containing protein [Actinobacteria bacterium]|nr:ATP-binding cassette domain-containing protein [Actinomycetota bacterium]
MSEILVAATSLTRVFTRTSGRGRMRSRERVIAVDGLDLTIARGESLGYIGANGAGKSTTIKMLTGILVPTSGSVVVCGLEPVKRRKDLARRIGVVFGQRSQLWWDLPLAESFTILAAIHQLPQGRYTQRLDELVEQLELGPTLQTPVRQLSLGQRMRGELAAALLHSPELVILDEPTIGLDVVSKERLRQFLLAERAAHGTTLLLTTHDMGDIERLCERVVVVDHGRSAYDGPLAELSRLAQTKRVLAVDFAEPRPPLRDIVSAQFLDSDATGVRQRFAFSAESATAAEVLAEVSSRGEVRDLTVEEPDIEAVVRALYQGQGR